MRNDLKPYNMLVLLIISAKKYTSNPRLVFKKQKNVSGNYSKYQHLYEEVHLFELGLI